MLKTAGLGYVHRLVQLAIHRIHIGWDQISVAIDGESQQPPDCDVGDGIDRLWRIFAAKLVEKNQVPCLVLVAVPLVEYGGGLIECHLKDLVPQKEHQ